jgi:hypothetical protein
MPCTTLDANPAPARTLTCAAGASIPTTPDIDTAAAAPSRYIVYGIEELASGRHYVGLTRRPLDVRITSHLRQSRRRGQVRPGGLMEALRLMDALGQAIEDCFGVRVLGRADTAQEARDLERHWVMMLDSRVPHGLNGMPGGSSIGGVDNARALHVAWPEGVRAYPSIQAALTEVNRARSAADQPPLEVNTLYARLAGGWPVSQALGLEARKDPRKTRAPFQLGADTYTTLEAAAAATGLSVATLRSRLHRASRSDPDVTPQIGCDRRSRASGRTTRLSIPWPDTGECLTAAAYAARTGVSKATVMHRWHRARAAWREATNPSAGALYAFLTAPAAGKRAARAAVSELLAALGAGKADHAVSTADRADASAF